MILSSNKCKQIVSQELFVYQLNSTYLFVQLTPTDTGCLKKYELEKIVTFHRKLIDIDIKVMSALHKILW